MKKNRLTDSDIKKLEPKPGAKWICYDDDVKGFGVCVFPTGTKSFVLNYRAGGRERRITIGSCSDWKVGPARDHAKLLKQRIDLGEDPMGDRHAERAAPTVEDLAERFEREHLIKRRGSTAYGYKLLLRLHILPKIGKIKVADLRHADIEKLHREVAAKVPYQANRSVAVLSKMLSLAVKWEIRTDNPARGIERAPEEKRERFLAPVEIAKLAEVLASHKERTSCNAIRMLLLTGARRGEMLAARWAEFDLKAGVWTKPSAHTKQKKEHRVPLSAPARALLAEMRAEADAEIEKAKRNKLKYHDEFVFPGLPGKHLTEIKRIWLAVCIQAGLAKQVAKTDAKGKPVKDAKGEPVLIWQNSARIHDLRHSYASILASSGLSLPIIGALLGHTQTATTARYAHLMDDPLRAATERVGAVVTGVGKPSADVVQIGEKRA